MFVSENETDNEIMHAGKKMNRREGERGSARRSLTISMRLSWIRFSVVLSLLLIRPRPDDSYCRIDTGTHTE